MKKKIIELIEKDQIDRMALNMPLLLLEGYEQEFHIKNNAVVISSKIQSSLYNSIATISYDFYKPISKI